MGFNDPTLGSQLIGFVGPIKYEMCLIGVSNDISASNVIPTTLTNLQGWLGNADFSAGCVSGAQSSGITNMSLCTGPVLEISVSDASTGIVTENGRLHYQAWGW